MLMPRFLLQIQGFLVCIPASASEILGDGSFILRSWIELSIHCFLSQTTSLNWISYKIWKIRKSFLKIHADINRHGNSSNLITRTLDTSLECLSVFKSSSCFLARCIQFLFKSANVSMNKKWNTIAGVDVHFSCRSLSFWVVCLWPAVVIAWNHW